ncbi:diphthine--ammonia ligase [Methanothrix harundinacea]|uniref:Putative ATP binding protein n=1 Tax=Methanothrix harundinacea (strain 6Ac) TaxID=1110509 RepID=G7WNG3_METH6|nr:diphthine--ammonia ligase [Methanothrix harundinacea]AET64654.1 Putative ATP binding protein [Methanothrix harundinacea 6Ac]
MILGVLFSGGKDSVYACRRAMETDSVACLITMVSANPDSYMFHTPNIAWAGLIAEAVGVPQLNWPTAGEEEAELSDLSDAIAAAVDEYGVEGIVTGAIESVYQAARVQRICRELDLWCYNPLWQIDQLEYLRLLVSEGFEVIITGVFAYPLDESFVGARIDGPRIEKLEDLRDRYAINPSGEGGEIETIVLDGPVFKRRVEVLKAVKEYDNYRGRLIIKEARLVER